MDRPQVDAKTDSIHSVEDGTPDSPTNGRKMVIFHDLHIRVNIFNFIDVVVDFSDKVHVCLNAALI